MFQLHRIKHPVQSVSDFLADAYTEDGLLTETSSGRRVPHLAKYCVLAGADATDGLLKGSVHVNCHLLRLHLLVLVLHLFLSHRILNHRL